MDQSQMTAVTGDNDRVVMRARASAEALGRLYELYYDKIYRYCLHRLFSRELAEDVASSVFLTVAKDMRIFKGTTEKEFRNWIYTIATNQANDHVRKTVRRKKLLFDAALTKETSADGDKGGWPGFHRAILELKPAEQAIITMRFFEGLKSPQIAEIFNTSPGNVRVRIARAVAKLREYLTGADADDIRGQGHV